MKIITIVSGILVLLSFAASGQTTIATNNTVELLPQSPLVPPVLDDRHRLGGGDRVTFRILEDQDEPRTLVVGDSGELHVPYIGVVSAANKTCRELAKDINARLEKNYYYQATVLVMVESVNKTRSLGKVYVGGQVKNSGVQEIPADETYTLGKAILKAGGFSDFSDKKRVRVTRNTGGKKKTFVIDVLEVWEKGRLDKDLVLQPNDSIYVPERLINF